MYLPLFQDNPGMTADAPVFFGGINVYLQQKLGLFRRTPRWIDQLFDSNWLLKMAARKSGSTRADALGGMTVSMLSGEEGFQSKEIERLMDWLREQEKPDLIHISNALLLGLADTIKRDLDVPVFCSLQDEDVWIDAMKAKDRDLCWQKIKEKAESVDMFIAVSNYYAGVMQRRLNLPAEKLRVVRLGVDTDGFKKSILPENPAVIGFMARMSQPLGLGLLIEAFTILKKMDGYRDAKLRVCGGSTADDRAFLQRCKRDLVQAGVDADVEFISEFHHEARIEFLQSLSLLSVPSLHGSAFGSYLIEAMAAGVPVVQPDIGSFPEIVNESGGGVIYTPNTPERLAECIGELLSKPHYMSELGNAGKDAAKSQFSIERMATELLNLYREMT